MNNSAFVEMSKYLLDYGRFCEYHYTYHGRHRRGSPDDMNDSWQPFFFTLGGTPLNTTLLLVRDMVNDFRKETSAQIVNLVFLTDGESHSLDYDHAYLKAKGHFDREHSYDSKVILRDPITKTQYKMSWRNLETAALLKIVRKSCNVNAINFYISNSRGVPHELWHLTTRADKPEVNFDLRKSEFRSKWRKEKAITIEETHGFSEVHLIAGSAALRTESTGLDDIEVGESKGKMAKAFIKANTKRKTSRIVLSRFIDRIAA